MKRFFALLLTIFLCVSSLFADNTAKGASPWAKPEIQKALSMGLIHRDLNSAYRLRISRQDFCKLMVGIYLRENGFSDIDELLTHGMQLAPGQEFKFEDLNYRKPDYKYVAAANALGLVNGVSENLFAPNREISREQAAKIYAAFYRRLARDKGIDPALRFQYDPFLDDAEISSWAKGEVYFLGVLKVMEGVEGKFDPKGAYSREQSFVTALRVYEAYQNLAVSEGLKQNTKSYEAPPFRQSPGGKG